uniref:MerI n=1 Tax=Saccharolobus solfataricus TaxID=2287 RepID=A1YZ79_SACSO|nr:MerI [Saccharolobus solfataricus 98/2]
MPEVKRLYEDEELEEIALRITDEEIEVVDRRGVIKGKISSKQLAKKALEKKTLKFRITEAIDTKITKEDEKALPNLIELYFDPHLLIYGKKAEEVKGSGYICPICGIEIDEYGYCGCGTGSS